MKTTFYIPPDYLRLVQDKMKGLPSIRFLITPKFMWSKYKISVEGEIEECQILLNYVNSLVNYTQSERIKG